MAESSRSASYDPAQRALHWIMAALIFAAIALGIWASLLTRTPLLRSPLRAELLTLHKSLGMTALVLVVPRLAWRAIAGAPAYRPPLDRLNHIAAEAGHGLLYLLMLALPVSGYLNSAAGGHDISWFGLFDWPLLAPQDKALGHAAAVAHYWLAWVIGAALALHLAAVVWHAAVKRDRVLARMWPSRGASDQLGRAASARS